MSARPFVSFVGAGPGDAELITVKGLKRLRAADVVVHDRLVAPGLLDEVRADAEIIDVGKAPGRHCVRQAEINALLVDRAVRGRSLVRLKGGDPGVFGRLAEEIRALSAAGISFEIVPGVSAGLAAAARVGISLTERGAASTIVLATGTDYTDHLPSLDWDGLARAEATLVFYMAVRSLAAITDHLIAGGRSRSEPAVVVERAATRDERVVRATLGTIAGAARERAIASPAILITGPTVDPASAPRAAYPMPATVEV